ncbi:MAG: UDP-galactopyranose mutase [Erysipelotrichaceae bacterium]|nr:UDP-galactopyranose mutase [Erysipelotrichaceae bacterium]
MASYDYLVVGSGITGATLAYLLKQKGKKVLVLEKRAEVGGNVATRVEDGVIIHSYGPHIFHTSSKEAWDFLNAHSTVDPFINTPLAFYKGKYYNMPFNMNTFHQLFGVNTAEEAKSCIDAEVALEGIKEPKNLEEQALALVGRTIYETLVKGYTEKQWGRKATELPASIIKRLPLRFEYNNNYFNDIFQGEVRGGFSRFIENLLEGIEVRLGVDYLQDKDKYDAMAEHVIFTGRIDELFGFSLGHLEWRSLRFESEWKDVDSFQPVAVVNYTDREPAYTRITEHKKFDAFCENHRKTYITYEYPDAFEEGKIPYYTVNDERNAKLAEAYKALAEKNPKIILAGRLATYRYLDMDDALVEAFRLFETLE